MPIFEYEARDQQGQLVSGVLPADSEGLLVRQLQSGGLFVTSVRPARERRARGEGRPVGQVVFRPVRTGEMAVCYRELAAMIGAGMTIVRALDVLEQNTTNPRLRQALRGVSAGVERGQPLSQQMARFPTIFNEIAVALVEAGERSGRLDDMLKRLATYTEYQLEVEQLIRRETMYPKLVGAFILLVLIFLPLVPAIVMGGSGWQVRAIAQLLLLAGVIAAAIIVPRLLMSTEWARELWDDLKIKLPIFGGIARRFALSRFSRALAALYESGVSLASGLPTAGRASGNRIVAEAMTRASSQVQTGVRLSDALVSTGLVPHTVLAMVRTGEESGDLGGLLDKVADYYEDEAKTSIHRISVMILPIFLLIAGAIVLIMLVSFYVGLYGSILGG